MLSEKHAGQFDCRCALFQSDDGERFFIVLPGPRNAHQAGEQWVGAGVQSAFFP